MLQENAIGHVDHPSRQVASRSLSRLGPGHSAIESAGAASLDAACSVAQAEAQSHQAALPAGKILQRYQAGAKLLSAKEVQRAPLTQLEWTINSSNPAVPAQSLVQPAVAQRSEQVLERITVTEGQTVVAAGRAHCILPTHKFLQGDQQWIRASAPKSTAPAQKGLTAEAPCMLPPSRALQTVSQLASAPGREPPPQQSMMHVSALAPVLMKRPKVCHPGMSSMLCIAREGIADMQNVSRPMAAVRKLSCFVFN